MCSTGVSGYLARVAACKVSIMCSVQFEQVLQMGGLMHGFLLSKKFAIRRPCYAENSCVRLLGWGYLGIPDDNMLISHGSFEDCGVNRHDEEVDYSARRAKSEMGQSLRWTPSYLV